MITANCPEKFDSTLVRMGRLNHRFTFLAILRRNFMLDRFRIHFLSQSIDVSKNTDEATYCTEEAYEDLK